jgi:hypothetical protein
MSFESNVNIPNQYWVHVDSNNTAFAVDADLDNIRIKELPLDNIQIKYLPTINLGDINVRIKEIPEIKTASSIDVSIKEIPDTRVHLPANYHLGLSLLGICLLKVSLCGEGQIITEKYVPRRMELC